MAAALSCQAQQQFLPLKSRICFPPRKYSPQEKPSASCQAPLRNAVFSAAVLSNQPNVSLNSAQLLPLPCCSGGARQSAIQLPQLFQISPRALCSCSPRKLFGPFSQAVRFQQRFSLSKRRQASQNRDSCPRILLL